MSRDSSLLQANFALMVLLVGLAPAFMVLMAWDFGNFVTPYRGFMRGNSLPVSILEFLFLFLTMARGFSPFAAISSLPTPTKVGLSLFFIITIWTTIFVAESWLIALIGMLKLFAHLMFGLSIAYQITHWTEHQRSNIWAAIGLGVVSYCLLWGANIAIYHPAGEDWMWLVPAVTNIRWIGFFALAGFCGGLGALVFSSNGQIDRSKITMPIMLCALGCFIALWTASRGALMAIIVASAFALLASRDRRTMAAIVLAAVVFAIAVAAIIPVPHPAYGLERIFASALQTHGVDQLSSGRIQLWEDTISKVAAQPWLGWGIDQFRLSGPENSLGLRHPHQSVLQLLFSTGLAGVVALTLIAAPSLKHFPMTLASPARLAAGSYAVAGTIYGLHDGFFYYTYPVMIYIVSIAMVLKPDAQTTASDRSD